MKLNERHSVNSLKSAGIEEVHFPLGSLKKTKCVECGMILLTAWQDPNKCMACLCEEDKTNKDEDRFSITTRHLKDKKELSK